MQVLKVNGSELQKEKVNYLSRDNGLAGESASKMASDYFGRMWIATSGGVSVFNGVQVATVPFEGQEGMRPQSWIYVLRRIMRASMLPLRIACIALILEILLLFQ